MNSIKIKSKNPFGVIVAEGARKYIGYALEGAKKALIVSDETVFRLFGHGLKKIIKSANVEPYTFIYPTGENGKTKHVLDKLLILMTELDIQKTDCIVAFGGRQVLSLVGFASKVFRGGVPYMYLPTTISGALSFGQDGVASVDFIGKSDLLRVENYPVAVFTDTEYLKTLPAVHFQNGIVEIIRLGMIGDGEMIEEMETSEPHIDELIFRAIKVKQSLNAKKFLSRKRKKDGVGRYALNFASIAEKIVGLKVPYGKLVAYGMVISGETASAIGLSNDMDERITALLNKYDIKWDIGIVTTKLWQTFLENTNEKIKLILPVKPGRTVTKKFAREKIKEKF